MEAQLVKELPDSNGWQFKPVWATEMSWDSNPPDPAGIPAAQQAQWAAGAIYVLWRQGVRALFWWNLRDDAPDKSGSYATTLQSGVYYRGATVEQDKPKPAVTAFRFPFVAYARKSSVFVWGRVPVGRSARVSIQWAPKGGRWKNVAPSWNG